MTTHRGQAIARALGRTLAWTARILLVTLGLLLVGAGALAVRLSRGPMDVTRLTRHFAAPRLSLSHATIFWNLGSAPATLVLTLRQPVLRRPDLSVLAACAEATVGVLPGRLLIGRIRPVSIAIRNGSVALRRGADGGITLDAGAPTHPRGKPDPDRTWRALRHLTVQGLNVAFNDAALGPIRHGRVNALQLDSANGGWAGNADLTLRLGAQDGTLVATLAPTAGGRTEVAGQIGALNPAALGPMFGPDALPFDGTASAGFRVMLDPAWQPASGAADLRLGPGRLLAGGGIGVTAGIARITAVAAERRARLTGLRVTLASGAILGGGAEIAWAGARANAAAALDIDRIPFAELGKVWPANLAPDARAWVTINATAGVASAVHVDLGFALAGGAVQLTRAIGGLRATDLTLAWLSPVPPLVHAAATLTLASPDALAVAISRAEQAPSDPASPPLVISNATLAITGLSAPHQTATIEAAIGGPVPQMIALLREPRLHLLAAHPVNFGAPAGIVQARLRVQVPLENHVSIDQIPIHADGQFQALHLGGLIGGKDLDAGALTLAATNDGLTLTGAALLAGIPSHLTVTQDFRAGPPDQVVSRYQASGTATAEQVKAAGFPAGDLAQGAVSYAAALAEHRNGAGEAAVHIDLRAAALRLPALAWSKTADTDTTADATVRLDHDRLIAVDKLAVVGPGVSVQGHASYAAGQPVTLDFDTIVLGNTRAAGQLRFPPAIEQPILADLRGSVLDLSARLKPDPAARTPGRAEAAAAARARRGRAATAPAPRGRPWRADLHFDQVLLGPKRALTNVTAHADNDGLVVRHALMTGTAGSGPFRLSLVPAGAGRAVHATAADAAGLLAALDLLSDVRGGTLTLDAAYDDRQPDHPLSGTAAIDRFRVVGAPSMARLLQAMTLYGVVDVLRGPGLGITHLVAPFRFANQVLTLDGARAFSGSLGFTAKGDIDLAAARADLAGTIVPAYFFNTLLGKVPVVGKLFSPEKGGGVFAAGYTLSGPLANLKVGVNPLTALTPGFLRGLFGTGNAPPGDDPKSP